VGYFRIFIICKADELPGGPETVADQFRSKLGKLEKMRITEPDNRMIGPEGEQVGKQERLADPYPSFTGKVGHEPGRAFRNRITAEKTGFGAFFNKPVNEFLVTAAKENLGLVLEFGVKNACVTNSILPMLTSWVIEFAVLRDDCETIPLGKLPGRPIAAHPAAERCRCHCLAGRGPEPRSGFCLSQFFLASFSTKNQCIFNFWLYTRQNSSR
jgi:hypothetical protein